MASWANVVSANIADIWLQGSRDLLGLETYTEAIDMWSVGCIMAELLHHQPLFPAKTELGILELMAKLLGSPNERIWPVSAFCQKENLSDASFRHASSCHDILLPQAVLSGQSAGDPPQSLCQICFYSNAHMAVQVSMQSL